MSPQPDRSVDDGIDSKQQPDAFSGLNNMLSQLLESPAMASVAAKSMQTGADWFRQQQKSSGSPEQTVPSLPFPEASPNPLPQASPKPEPAVPTVAPAMRAVPLSQPQSQYIASKVVDGVNVSLERVAEQLEKIKLSNFSAPPAEVLKTCAYGEASMAIANWQADLEAKEAEVCLLIQDVATFLRAQARLLEATKHQKVDVVRRLTGEVSAVVRRITGEPPVARRTTGEPPAAMRGGVAEICLAGDFNKQEHGSTTGGTGETNDAMQMAGYMASSESSESQWLSVASSETQLALRKLGPQAEADAIQDAKKPFSVSAYPMATESAELMPFVQEKLLDSDRFVDVALESRKIVESLSSLKEVPVEQENPAVSPVVPMHPVRGYSPQPCRSPPAIAPHVRHTGCHTAPAVFHQGALPPQHCAPGGLSPQAYQRSVPDLGLNPQRSSVPDLQAYQRSVPDLGLNPQRT